LLRILHFADLHLDRAFGSLAAGGRSGPQPRQALRTCLEGLIDLALEREVDAITIGGDLFEHDRATTATAAFLKQQFARLGNVPVFIAPGNHDPLVSGSLYRQIEWPGNVKVAEGTKLQRFDLDGSTVLWTAAFTAPVCRDCPLSGFHLPQDGRRHLLLLHADLGQTESDYCPLPPSLLQEAGFQAALLGHLHDGRLSRPELSAWYPGSPSPLDFSEEQGEHRALLLELGEGSLQPERLDVATLRFSTLRVDVSGLETLEQVRDRVLEQAGDPKAVLRVVLEGERHPDLDLDISGLISALTENADRCLMDIADETSEPYDFEVEAQGKTARARFVRRMQQEIGEAASEEEKDMLKEALLLGLLALDGRPLRPSFWRKQDAAEQA